MSRGQTITGGQEGRSESWWTSLPGPRGPSFYHQSSSFLSYFHHHEARESNIQLLCSDWPCPDQSWTDQQTSPFIWEQRCQALEECRGVKPAMVPQEIFVVSERNHPSRPCPPFLAPRPFRYLCESQDAKAKLCSRSLIHSQGEGGSIWGKEGRQHWYGVHEARSLS